LVGSLGRGGHRFSQGSALALIRKKPVGPEEDAAELANVSLSYGRREVLRGLSLRLPPKSFHFLTGASGAGKTSLLALLYLAHRPTSGSLKLFGEEVADASRARLARLRRRLGVVFQDFRLLDHLTTFDNVALPLRIAGVKEDVVREHVTELLKWVGLADYMAALPEVLSGGEKQRVAIARAVINRPRLVLADEPTGNVDDTIAVRLMQLFVELHRLGSSVLMATHNESLVKRFPFPRLHLDGGALAVLPPLAAPVPSATN
jgi:cell division transport system ATP-binding protein